MDALCLRFYFPTYRYVVCAVISPEMVNNRHVNTKWYFFFPSFLRTVGRLGSLLTRIKADLFLTLFTRIDANGSEFTTAY